MQRRFEFIPGHPSHIVVTSAHRLVAIFLTLTLALGNMPASAAPADERLSGAAAAEPTPPVVTAPTGARSPLIEVSVDSLEISEASQNLLGFLWGQPGAAQNGLTALDPNRINFLEAAPPGIFDVAKFNRSQLMTQFQALIRNNQVRILANPTLLTKSGFEATFLVGGEIPYPTPAPVGQAPGVEFKKYGVGLKILPTITPRNTIEAQINVGVSNPDDSRSIQIQGTNVPGISSREAGTKVEVNDGETVVIAGIKQSQRTKIISKVPILGSIPLIGLLFRHKDETTSQTSLVLFVTFRLVK